MCPWSLLDLILKLIELNRIPKCLELLTALIDLELFKEQLRHKKCALQIEYYAFK